MPKFLVGAQWEPAPMKEFDRRLRVLSFQRADEPLAQDEGGPLLLSIAVLDHSLSRFEHLLWISS